MSVNAVSVSLKEMLTSCPKCGFSQPKDQYCAQCGVDMLAYRPPQKPLLQRASENLTVQLTIIFLIAISAIFFIMRNHNESIFSRMKFLRGSGPQVATSKNGNQFLPDTPSVTEEVAAETAVQESEVAEVASKADLKPKEAAPKKSETKISYLQIPTAVLNKWLEEGVMTRVETYDGITIAYIPQFEKVLELSQAQIKVLKETSFPYALNQLHTAKLEGRPVASAPTANRVLAQEAPGPAAFNAYATLDEEREDTVVGQLEVSTGPQTSIPAHFEMAPDVSFFMTGFSKARNPDRTPDSELVVVLQISK